MIGTATVLDALARYWPLILGGWAASSVAVAVFVARAGRALGRSPHYWRCADCGTVFPRPVQLAVHIEDHHPALMPRVDA